LDFVVVAERQGRPDLELNHRAPAPPPDAWSEVAIPLDDVAGGDRVTIIAVQGALRDFHLWITRP
jgi:hypothetical protein